MMNPKIFIISILIVTFITAVAAPTAYAEPVTATVTLICALVFTSAVAADKIIEDQTDHEMALKEDKAIPSQPYSARTETDRDEGIK